MTTADLAFGRRVVWRKLTAEIVDIHWTRRILVQIRVAGGCMHWVTPAELSMGEHIVKVCPRCGAPLDIKINRQTGEEFLGCSAWQPRDMGCSHTEPLPEAIKLRRQGQPDMFDEEHAHAD